MTQMRDFIELSQDGTPAFVRVDSIEAVTPSFIEDGDPTQVWFANGFILVDDSVADVMSAINGYRS